MIDLCVVNQRRATNGSPDLASKKRVAVSFTTQPLDAGTYRLRITSADSPQWGGLSGKYITTPSEIPPQHENATVQEYTFEVLPAEDGEE